MDRDDGPHGIRSRIRCRCPPHEKAVPVDDGTYRILRSKIFITWGDHDLTDNIVHLVLARLRTRHPERREFSFFVVPKMLVNDDGTVGAQDVETVSIEHKLGIHRRDPTCVLSFEDSVGYIVGEPNQGMRYMFAMMNQARREVGLEGLGISRTGLSAGRSLFAGAHAGRAIGTPNTEIY